jgi:hypothetical protein
MLAAQAFDSAPSTWHVDLYHSVPADADVVVVGPDVDVRNGIPFDPDHPDRVIDAIEQTLTSHGGAMTVVTSASGGTGATSVALHLAACGDVGAGCFVDLDVSFGAARRLNLPDKHLTWRDVGSSTESLMLAALPFPGGFRALISPGDGAEPDNAGELLARAMHTFSHVVADVPSGSVLKTALERSRAAVLVMRPDVVSAHRSKHLLAEHSTTRWAVVANRMGPGGETTLSALQKILDHPIALELPCAPALRDAEDEGRVLTSRVWRYTRAILRLQRALVET